MDKYMDKQIDRYKKRQIDKYMKDFNIDKDGICNYKEIVRRYRQLDRQINYTYIGIYIKYMKSSNLCLSVCMSDHKS